MHGQFGWTKSVGGLPPWAGRTNGLWRSIGSAMNPPLDGPTAREVVVRASSPHAPAARGFRNFENYGVRILFYWGKLDLMPSTSH